MDALTQAEIFALISELNSFADRSEALIARSRSDYESRRSALSEKYHTAFSGLEKSCNSNCEAISLKSKRALAEAGRMLEDVEALDARLMQVDKYYLKTKTRKEAELAGTTSERYHDSTDYFAVLEEIRTQYADISRKYSEDILPALLNGLNYLFSARRKKDYEELIVLLNTIRTFTAEIREVLPAVTSEGLAAQKNVCQTRRQELAEAQKRETECLENDYAELLDEVAGSICSELEQILPDELIEYLKLQMSVWEENRLKVNSGSTVSEGILYSCCVEYPVDFFVQSGIVSSLIKEKCAPILADGAIRFPISVTIQDAPVWLVSENSSDHSVMRAFSHAYMFGFLSSCPVAGLTFSIIDPENRGNSIAPFFDAKKKLPKLFGEKVYVSREDIISKINSLNQQIEETLQERLGTEFENIYVYSENTHSFTAEPELLVIYDFPRGFDEQSLSGLRNLLRNGSRCGIYTLILTSPASAGNRADEYGRGLKAIEGLTVPIQHGNGAFMLRGMPLLYDPMPEKPEFNKFFGKYMLMFEGIKNRGIAFSPLIKNLVDTRDTAELEQHIAYIGNMMTEFQKGFFRVPSVDALFPARITLGDVLYPADIFSESIDFEKVKKAFGKMEGLTLFNQLCLPLSLELNNTFNLLLHSPEKTAEEMRVFTHHVMWTLLSFLPVTKINFKIVDVENRASIKPFSDLKKALPEIFSVITNADQVKGMFQSLNDQIDDFMQNKLGAKYESILEYNQNTPRRSEPITLLVLYDFPAGMDRNSADLLVSILRNGSKCGIYTLICYDPEARFQRYESIEERLEQIEKYSISIEYKDGSYQMLPFGLSISIPEAKNAVQISDFVREYAEAADVIKHKGISFDEILPEKLFTKKASGLLQIPIGIGDEDAVISLIFGEGTSHHCLIGGGTGGGKSTLLHTIIMSSMLNYAPDQLHLYLMDFKGGTEFKIYESVRLPHIQLLALDALQEFGESILENLVQEMDRRSAVFKEAGGYTKLQDYVECTGLPMPRILIIMDEFQILFNDASNRKVAVNCASLAKRIVTEGRAYGIHLVMATQSTNIISTLTLDRGTIEQMRIRIGLKCGEADTRYLFSDLYCSDAKRKMMGPKGTAVLNEDYTESPENNDTSLQLGNTGLRVAFCDNVRKESYLKKISAEFDAVPCSTQIFEGSRTEKLLHHLYEVNAGYTEELPVVIHMGDKIKVAPPFCINIDRKKKHNLLICGTNVQMTNHVLHNYMVSALLNQNVSVYCIDGDTMVGEDTSENFYKVLKEHTGRFHMAESRTDIVRFIHDIYEEYQKRKKKNEKAVILMVMKNLQYLDLVKTMLKGERVDEREYLEEETEQPSEGESLQEKETEAVDANDPFAAFNSYIAGRNARKTASAPQKTNPEGYANEKLLKLIDDGSGFGIHFVVTSSDFQTVKESMRFGENVLSKFPERVVFSLSNNDADNLVENVSVAGLNSNLVYYTDGVRETFQLKPYISPSAEELDQFLKTLSGS